MMQLAIEEPIIEKFFNNSKDEIKKALKFIVDNNIQYFDKSKDTYSLSDEQTKELNLRISSFHNDSSMGRSWNEIKKDI